MSPEGAEWFLQQNSGQPDPTELSVPSQLRSHTLIYRSDFMVPSHLHCSTTNCVAVTLRLLKTALALLLPLPQCHGCVADRCPQVHPRSRWCRVSSGQHRVSLAVCQQLLRNARWNCKKPRFHSTSAHSCQPHPCRETKVHMRVDMCLSKCEHTGSQQKAFLGERHSSIFPYQDIPLLNKPYLSLG